MKARYFENADQVMFIHPINRFLTKLFGKDIMVHKCKDCKKIPTDVYGKYCLDCLKNKNSNNIQ